MYLGKRIRIAIVDNDRLTLGVMKMMIERILPQANVCWAVSDGLTAVSKSLNSRTRPDVLLVDMSLEGMSGYDVCRTIREETAQVDLVGMTAFSLDRYCVPALENGASCLVDKANVKGLCHVLCAIVNGRRADVKYASSESAQESHERLLTAKSGNVNYETFAKREREVMGLCSLGFTSKEIGIKLGIGEPTVKTYIRRVMKKLGAKNRTQAVIQWMEINEREY